MTIITDDVDGGVGGGVGTQQHHCRAINQVYYSSRV
jgi:hypothetical protein